MIFAFPFASREFRSIVLVAVMAFLAPASAKSAGSEANACKRWPQNRLILGDLQARRFVLEPKGPVREMPRLPAAEKRSVFHRTFGLSLDLAEPIAMFHTVASQTCVIARDREKSLPLRIPVFFVGRERQSLDDLRADAELAAFALSSSLHDGDDFAAIQFHLRKGGSRFNDIRPFFACGLPGLLVCEGDCPGDSAILAASLVNWVVSGATWPPPAVKSSRSEPAPPESCARAGPEDSGASKLDAPAQAAAGPPKCPEPQRTPLAPRAAAPKESQPPFAPAAAAAPLSKLVLAFESKSGQPIRPGDILAAEGKLSVEGVVLTETPAGLAASLPEGVLSRTKAPEVLRKLFAHYAVLSARSEEARIVLTVESLFVYAADLKINIANSAKEPVRDCELTLKVGRKRRAGRGWEKAAAAGEADGLKFRQAGASYELKLPSAVERNELLISTAGPGDLARLSNGAQGCQLEAKPEVTIDELQSGIISRLLRTAGPVLIALLSTDGRLSESAGNSAIEGFWSKALDLVGSVSEEEPWERKLLARAQSFGPSAETHLLQEARGSEKLAGNDVRGEILEALVKGSIEQPEPLAMIEQKPLQRFHLDLALKPLRDDAAIDPLDTFQQETLLLVTGGGGLNGSYFCRKPVPGDGARWAPPKWLAQARKTFALEVWTDATAEALASDARAFRPDGAPAGIYLCQSDGGSIVLYGVVPAALSASARTATFAYLGAQAKGYLKP
jgi:hypothetical protein